MLTISIGPSLQDSLFNILNNLNIEQGILNNEVESHRDAISVNNIMGWVESRRDEILKSFGLHIRCSVPYISSLICLKKH